MPAIASQSSWIEKSLPRKTLPRLWPRSASALTGDCADALQGKTADKVRLLGNIEALEDERRALWESPTAEGASR